MAKLQLGHMAPAQMMSMHVAAKSHSANTTAAKKSYAMYQHPSSGRNEAFLNSATSHVMAANNADATMSVANASVAPAESFNSRQTIFDTARQAHNFGSN